MKSLNKLLNSFNKTMAAASFAEAGDFETAVEIMREEKHPPEKAVKKESPSFKPVFDCYRKVLDSNNKAIEIIADISSKADSDNIFDINYIKNAYAELCLSIRKSMLNFEILTRNKYRNLFDVFNNIDLKIQRMIVRGISGDPVQYADSNPANNKNSFRPRDEIPILEYISPLNLVDPIIDNFTPEGCNTMHDILRFIHAKSVDELVSSTRYTRAFP